MQHKTCIGIFTLLSIQVIFAKDTYRAAVVDYRAHHDDNMTILNNLLWNVKQYEKFATAASKDMSDIIVFPEYGLTSTTIPMNQTIFLPYTLQIPTKTDSLCNENEEVHQVLKELSCIAKNNHIYLVVNIAEQTENENSVYQYRFYNTDVVFNRVGEIIAKYRKVNLYNEPYFKPNADEVKSVMFTTDFGVTFGIFTCFDILFYEPAKLMIEKEITDFIFPTAWISELPFLTALQIQSGWARAHGVNLIASNLQHPERGSGGSGVYSAEKGILAHFIPQIGEDTKLLIADVPKISKRLINHKYNSHNVEPMSLPLYTPSIGLLRGAKFKTIHTDVINAKLTHNKLTCDFKINAIYDGLSDYNYKLVSYDGPIHWGDTRAEIQVCALITCFNDSVSSCGLISHEKTKLMKIDQLDIKVNIGKHVKFLAFPSATTYDLKPLPYHYYTFDQQKNVFSMKINQHIENLITFGVYVHIEENEENSYLNLIKKEF